MMIQRHLQWRSLKYIEIHNMQLLACVYVYLLKGLNFFELIEEDPQVEIFDNSKIISNYMYIRTSLDIQKV